MRHFKKTKSLIITCLLVLYSVDGYLLLAFTPNYDLNLSKSNMLQAKEEITQESTTNVSEKSSTLLEKNDQSIDNVITSLAYDYVRNTPIPLDKKMEEHLNEFRDKAKQLQMSYPDSFYISLPTNEKVIALTFDDGPDKEATLKIIGILNDYNIPATFFFIGENIDKYPDVVKTALDNGHSIANHSWSHLRPTDLDGSELMQEVNSTEDKLMEFKSSGINNEGKGEGKVKFFRPPYGLVNEEQMPLLIESSYKVITWSIDSMDWYSNNPEDIKKCVIENIHPGAIILFHSSGGENKHQPTIESLGEIIQEIKNLGYSFCKLDELIK